MKTTIEEDKVRQQVRERYGAIARFEERGCGCGPSCGDSLEVKNRPTGAEELGYHESDVTAAPEGSEMGLGCGNPIAIASIKPGETVLDLGSGGGFDCFLDSKPCRITEALVNANQLHTATMAATTYSSTTI